MKFAMRSLLLLPLLLLQVVVTDAQSTRPCSNGVTGYEASDMCCPTSCGACGGSGCSQRTGGADACCTKNIKSSGDKCSVTKSAPCIIDTDTVDTGGETCPGGIPGINANDKVCCPLSCGSCGGSGCSGRPGGAASCCGSGVKANQGLCSVTGKAPCVLEEDTTPTETCPGGIPGINANDKVCCPLSCGSCGGSGCSGRPGGASSCCGSGVKKNHGLCSVTGAAPCVIEGDAPTETCPGGIPGINANDVVCCPLSCGSCGGSGCSGRPGGASSCCGSGVKANHGLCSVTGAAPCVISGPSPVPAPTPPTPTPVGDIPSYLITSPTPVMTIPDDPSKCSGGLPNFRYAASTGKVSKGRLYAGEETTGCFTMTDLYRARGFRSSGGVLSPKGPIYELDENNDPVMTVASATAPVTGKWLLESELYIENGATFYCKGTKAGGDCDALRIRSNGDDDFYEVRGYGGNMYFQDTVVTSWDTNAKKPQETYEGGRSYLNCVSEYEDSETCEGQAKNNKGECRFDLINTEAAYLGYFASESYGLTWKVRGFCKDLTNHEVFTNTNVYGDIKGSDIHHNYYGHYSYGHQGGVWTDNLMHHNWQYGFDPHDDSDYLTIARNKVWDNVNHGIIASKRCNNVKIYENIVSNGGAQAAGIFLHRSSDEAEVYDNEVWNMQDAGIAFLESMNAKIYNNKITNVKYGIRMSLGSAGNMIYDNTFDTVSDYGLYTYQGSDAPLVTSDGRPSYNIFENNEIKNAEGGVKFKYSDNISVIGNTFTGTKELEFFDAQNTKWSGNSLPSGVCVDNISSDDGNSVRQSTFTGSDGLPGNC